MNRRPNSDSKQRLFFALWPDEAARRRLASLASTGPARFGRFVPAENLHLTLAFLGQVSPGARACVETAADQLTARVFELVFTHLGCWPRPRVIWAGTESTPAPLGELVSALRAELSRCGLPAESRPYRAHVTLARNTGAPADFYAVCKPVTWRVDEFHLVDSKTLSSGARYQLLRSWPLMAGNPDLLPK